MGRLLVGRENELLALEAALADAANGTTGVLVIGEAGIGKTTLCQAFLERARVTGALTLTCGGFPAAGSELPYAPVVQVLRELRRDHGEVLDRALSPSSSAVLTALVPDLEGRPDASDAVGLTNDPSVHRARLLTVLTGLFDGLVLSGPVTLLVEDLHWVDDSTLAFLGMLLRGTPPRGLLVLLTARDPGLRPEQRRWCAIERAAGNLQSLQLPALTADETAEMLASLGPEKPSPATVSRVHRRSGGNPFLVGELARGGSADVPEAVRDMVRAELDALSTAGRTAVQAAAAAGRPVEPRILGDVVGDAESDEAYGAALDSGLLVSTADRYAIRHDLIRSAVDEGLLPHVRQELHRRLAESMAFGADDSAQALGEIAWHYDEAGDRERTAAWAMRAADAAERSGAFAAAHRQLQRVLACGSNQDRTTMLRRAALVADHAGHHAQALDHLDEALASDVGDDMARTAALLSHRSWVLMALNRVEEALTSVVTAELMVPAGPDAVTRIDVLGQMATLLGLMGQQPAARHAADEALTMASALGDRRRIGRAMHQVADATLVGVEGERSLTLLEAAWYLAVESGDAHDIASVGVSLTDRLLVMSRFVETVEAGLRARAALITAAEGRHWLDAFLISNLTQALMELGRWDEASALLDEGCVDDDLGVTRLGRARLRLRRGELDQADLDLHAVAHLQRHEEPQFGLEYDETLVELRLWQNRADDALVAARSALAAVDSSSAAERAGPLVLLGLRAAADLAVDARASGDDALLAAATAGGSAIAASPGAVFGSAPHRAAQSRGELARLEGRIEVSTWTDAVDSTRVGAYETAYVQWRLAEAILESGGARSRATGPLRDARATACSLGARPMQSAVEGLAERGRVTFDEPDDVVPPPARRGPALSPREVAVLSLVARGMTNKEIGRELYMSPKTASAHVTHLMRKLGVRSRVQAAAVAYRVLPPRG